MEANDPSLEICLLQLDFPSLLGESTGVEAPRGEAVVDATSTDTIALADFFTSADLDHAYLHSELSSLCINRPMPDGTYMHDPTAAKDRQSAVDAALAVHRLFTAGGEDGALGLQAAEVLFVPAVDDARAPSGGTACERGTPSDQQTKHKK